MVVVRTYIRDWGRDIGYKMMEGRAQLILGYSRLKKFEFRVDCNNDSLVRKGERESCAN